jgi:hypothetical protein
MRAFVDLLVCIDLVTADVGDERFSFVSATVKRSVAYIMDRKILAVVLHYDPTKVVLIRSNKIDAYLPFYSYFKQRK